MELKNTTTMIIGLAISVVLVAGLMVPVISSLDNSGGGEGEVLYTNTGDYYYNPVTASTSTALSFGVVEDPETFQSIVKMSINGGEAKTIVRNGIEMPAWTSNNSFEFAALPLFTFITSDGKYGVEGIASIGLEDMEAEYVLSGGLMYFRMVQGSVPELHYMVGSAGEISVTLSNGSVSYVFQTEDVPTQLNGTYLLGIVDDATGEYTLTSDRSTVLDSTKFYMADWFGMTSIEVEAETQDSLVVVGKSMAVGGYGTIADYSDLSNLSVYDFERSNVISAVMNTTPAESEDGVVLESLSLQSDDSSVYELYGFIVPTKITTGGEGLDIPPTLLTLISVIPLITVIGIVIGTIGFIRYRS